LFRSDEKVVLSKRSAITPYAPGSWSASFEEQLTDSDLAYDDENAVLLPLEED
jgi:hypothetical protein